MERDKSQLQAQKALNLVVKEQVGEKRRRTFLGAVLREPPLLLSAIPPRQLSRETQL